MKNRLVLIFLTVFPALIGIACLQTTYPAGTPAAATPTPVQEDLRTTMPAAEAAFIAPSPAGADPDCAQISADEALHLRQDPDPFARVLAFMARGEVVKLLSTTNADWWLIKRGDLIGYARAKYLEITDCNR